MNGPEVSKTGSTGDGFSAREAAAAQAITEAEGTPPDHRHFATARLALAAADRVAPPLVPPSCHEDGIDAGAAVDAFVSQAVERLPPHPCREVERFRHVDGDGFTTLFWHRNRLAAVGVVVRDVSNWSVAATWANPEILSEDP